MLRPCGLPPILFAFLVVLGIGESSWASEPNAVLFSPTLPGFVLLIKDPAEIAQLTRRVLENERVPHACEGDWAIVFRYPDNVLKYSSYSEDHERYLRDDVGTHELLDSFLSRLRQKKEEGKRILIRLAIAADVPVEEAIEALERGGEEVFFFGRKTDRLPRIILESTASAPCPDVEDERRAVKAKVDAKADALLEESVEVVKQWRSIASTTPIRYFSRGGASTWYRVRKKVTVHFPFGTDLSNMPVFPDDVVLEEAVAPQEYFINIVASAQAFEKMQKSLPRKHSFVRNVIASSI